MTSLKPHHDVRPLNRFPEEKSDDETIVVDNKKCHCEKNTSKLINTYYKLNFFNINYETLFLDILNLIYVSEMLERMLRDITTIKMDVKTLMQDLNNTKLTEYEQLDGQLHFQIYSDLESFSEKLTEADYFNKIVSNN